MTTLKSSDYEKFNMFIFAIDDSILEAKELARQHGIELDFSENTPANIEKIILLMDIKRDNHHMINVFGQYLGEFFIKSVGGHWKLGDDPESSLDFNQPVIAGHNTVGYVFDPIMTIRTFASRRKAGIIASSIEAESGIDDLDLKPE